MERLNKNDLNQAAKLCAKLIIELGSPFGPQEAFVYGALYAQRELNEKLEELKSEIERLKQGKKE